jgi:hypothetical protein
MVYIHCIAHPVPGACLLASAHDNLHDGTGDTRIMVYTLRVLWFIHSSYSGWPTRFSHKAITTMALVCSLEGLAEWPTCACQKSGVVLDHSTR